MLDGEGGGGGTTRRSPTSGTHDAVVGGGTRAEGTHAASHAPPRMGTGMRQRVPCNSRRAPPSVCVCSLTLFITHTHTHVGVAVARGGATVGGRGVSTLVEVPAELAPAPALFSAWRAWHLCTVFAQFGMPY